LKKGMDGIERVVKRYGFQQDSQSEDA